MAERERKTNAELEAEVNRLRRVVIVLANRLDRLAFLSLADQAKIKQALGEEWTA